MKKLYFFWILFFLSTLLFAVFLGKLDFFGFLDGRHEVNFKMLFGAILSSYILTLSAVFLDIINQKNKFTPIIISCILFVLTFFLSNGKMSAAILAGILFVGFIWIITSEAKKRLELFIKINPQELFFPIFRRGFLFIVGMFAVINFFQSQARIDSNSLISPGFVKTISKPLIVVFNKQLESQMQEQLGSQFGSTENTAAKKQIVEFVLKQTIQSMLKQDGHGVGINIDDIPAEKTIIYDNGAIDISPVIADMADEIAYSLNQTLLPYAFIAPFIVALATIIIFQPLMWPIEIVESYLSRVLFFILLKTGLIKIRKETREVERIGF